MSKQAESLIKLKSDDLEIEYEILPFYSNDKRRMEIYDQMQSIDERLAEINQKVDEVDAEIDRLTNHADGWDYGIAVASGVITGLIDSFFVGDYNPNINDIVDRFKKRFSESAKLEETYHTANDSAYQYNKHMGVGGLTHRLDDIAHHPTLIGLAAYIFSCYFKHAIFIDRHGNIHLAKLKTGKSWAPIIISAVLMWLANVAERYIEGELDAEIPSSIKKIIKLLASMPLIIELFKCANEWFGHIMSDVSTSAGIPGIFLSLMKEISSLPFPNNDKLAEFCKQKYRDGEMSFANELEIIDSGKKQAIPVIINEVIVRAFYFVRHLIGEYKSNNGFEGVNWQRVFPFGNRTINRMMTIASGTFMAVDMADAAIRGAVNSGGNGAVFAKEFILRVNFVGIGRFAVAVGTDVAMGVQRYRKESERRALYSEMITLTNAKVFYSEADMWISIIDAGKAIDDAYETANNAAKKFAEEINEITKAVNSVTEDNAVSFKQNNSELTDDLLDILDF